MEYIGALRPSFPVNDFSHSVYREIDGDGNKIYYRHLVRSGGIEEFLLLPVEQEERDVILIPGPIPVKFRDEPIYSYVFENFTVAEGTYQELKSKLFTYLMRSEFNMNARLIIASFFKFHGLTIRLAEASKKYFEEIRLNVVMDPMDFIFTKRLAIVDPELIRQVCEECGLTLRLYDQLSLKDLVIFRNGQVYIGPYNLKAGILLHLAPVDISKEIHSLIDADPAQVISMLKQDGVFKAVVTGAVRYEPKRFMETIDVMQIERSIEEKDEPDPRAFFASHAYGMIKLNIMVNDVLADNNYVNREKSDYATW